LNLVLKEIERKEKADAFFNSITVARLAHIVISGLGGKQAAQQTKIEELLPFKASEIFGSSQTDCTPQTVGVLKSLIKKGQLPLFLMPALKSEIEA
jgi:hypothetical protein